MLLQVHIPALSAKTDAAEMAVDEVLVFCFHGFFNCTYACDLCLQCFDAVGWAAGRASGL